MTRRIAITATATRSPVCMPPLPTPLRRRLTRRPRTPPRTTRPSNAHVAPVVHETTESGLRIKQ